MILLSKALSLLLVLGASPGQVVDRVAATVNGEPITLGELEDRTPSGSSPSAGAGALTPEKARWKGLKTTLDQAIDEKLFETQASALQIEVSDAQIDQAVEDVKRRNHFDDVQLNQALASQGMSRESFRKMVKHNLESYEILRSKVSNRVKVTDEDLRNYYQSHPAEFAAEEEVHVRHIFLALPKSASPADVTRIQGAGEQVLKRLRGGEDFSKVAKEV